MKKTNALKTHLEKLMNEEDNQYCFDCEKKPAHWSSVNNGIYLCFNCSGEHRGLGVSISYVRSVTLDAFNENQVKMMALGGNRRLNEFLSKCGISRSIPIKQLYSSKIMNFYRRMLKAFANDEQFDEDLPDRNEMIDSYTAADNSNFNNKMITINDNHYTKSSSYSNVGNNSYNGNKYESVSSKDSSDNFNYPHFDNKMISINDNHYSNKQNYSNVSSDGKKFESVSSKYNNDSRFASISSEPLENYTVEDQGYSTTGSKLYSFLGTAFNITKNVAGALKEKVSEMDIASKLIYTGGKTVEVLKYTGSKVIEKSSDIAQSETVQTISQKASDGISYLFGKWWGPKNNNDEDGTYNNNQSSRYSGVSSDSGNNYSQMNENKKEKFLYDRDRDYY